MDYEIFKSKLFNIENSKRLAKDTEIIYESILEDIYQELNKLHNTSFTKRFYVLQLVLGCINIPLFLIGV